MASDFSINDIYGRNHSSYDTIEKVLENGPPIILSFNVWTVISNFIILAISLLLARVFRCGSWLAFLFLGDRNCDWDVDQLRAQFKNAQVASQAILDFKSSMAWKYLRNRPGDSRTAATVIFWKLCALAVISTTALAPFILASIPIIPASRLGNSDSDRCVGWVAPNFNDLNYKSSFFPWFAKTLTEVVAITDAKYRFMPSDLDAAAGDPLAIGLNPGESYIANASCPSYADPQVCNTDNPLHVGTVSWLSPSEAQVGGAGSDGLRVRYSQDCYNLHPDSFTSVYETDSTGNQTIAYHLGSLGGANMTFLVSTYDYLGSSYSWESTDSFEIPMDKTLPEFAQMPDNFTTEIAPLRWQPNSTLRHEGDTTILLFRGAGPISGFESKDPLFETEARPTAHTEKPQHRTRNLAVPIVCNVSYTVCHKLNSDGSEDGDEGSPRNEACTYVGGVAGLYNYSKSYTGKPQAKGFLQTLAFESAMPLITSMTGFTTSIFASQSLFGGVQSCPKCISGRTELLRLQLTARTWLAGAARRVADRSSTYKIINDVSTEMGMGSLQLYTTPEQKVMCDNTILEDRGKVIIPGRLVFILVGVVLGIMVVLYVVEFVEILLWPVIGSLLLRWRSYGFPQLHRMLAEKTTGILWRGAAKKTPSGPAVDDWDRSRRIGSLRIVRVNEYGQIIQEDEEECDANEEGIPMKDGRGFQQQALVTAQHQSEIAPAPLDASSDEKLVPTSDKSKYGVFYTVVMNARATGKALTSRNLPKRRLFR